MFRRALLWMLFLCLMFFVAAFFLSSRTPAPTPIPTPIRELIIQSFPPSTSVPTPLPIIILPTPETNNPAPNTPRFYTVLPGDTLSGIAAQFGLDVRDLAQVNGLTNPDFIEAGQLLLLATPDPLDGPQSPNREGKQIVVVLSEQMTYAYEDGLLLKEFLVSTGVSAHPTVLGHYAIYVKLEKTRMTGPGYDLKDVPWTMYFYQGYGFHGTYWHNNFGTPMSHGCVNLSTPDADWLYHWASVGTPVLILP